MKPQTLVAITVIALLVAGCGGGGTKLASDGSPPITPPVSPSADELGRLPSGGSVLSPTVFQIGAGSEWRYNVTGWDLAGKQTDVKGTYRTTVSAETILPPPDLPYSNDTLHYFLETADVVGSGIKILTSERRFFKQDADGTIWVYGWYNWEDPSSPHWADERYAWVRSPLSAGVSWEALVKETLPDNTGELKTTILLDEHWVVTGTETLTIPAGRCQTYRVTGNGKFGGLDPKKIKNMDVWWAPQIGAPAQVRLTYEADGQTVRLLFQLASLTVH